MLSRPETAASTVVPRWGDTMTRALNLKPAALTFAVAGTIAIATVGPATSSEIPWPYPGPPRRMRIGTGSAVLVRAWCA